MSYRTTFVAQRLHPTLRCPGTAAYTATLVGVTLILGVLSSYLPLSVRIHFALNNCDMSGSEQQLQEPLISADLESGNQEDEDGARVREELELEQQTVPVAWTLAFLTLAMLIMMVATYHLLLSPEQLVKFRYPRWHSLDMTHGGRPRTGQHTEAQPDIMQTPVTTEGRKVKGWVWIHSTNKSTSEVKSQVDKVIDEMRENPDFNDGIILVGPVQVEVDPATCEPYMAFNETQYNVLEPIIRAAQARKISVATMVGALPALWTSAQEPLKVLNKNRTWFCSDPRRDDFSLDRLVQTSVELAYKYGWDSGGYNVDDESGDFKMRTTAQDNELWFEFVRVWADGLHKNTIPITADIAVQWAVDDMDLRARFDTSPVDQWVPMDLYFGDATYFRMLFGFYLWLIPRPKLVVPLLPAGNPTDPDVTELKIRAIEAAGISEVWMFTWPDGYKTAPDWGYLFKEWKKHHIISSSLSSPSPPSLPPSLPSAPALSGLPPSVTSLPRDPSLPPSFPLAISPLLQTHSEVHQ